VSCYGRLSDEKLCPGGVESMPAPTRLRGGHGGGP
jgi:hypothetical protein